MTHNHFDLLFGAGHRPRRELLNADAYRRGDNFHLEIDAPGVDLDDIDVEVEKRTLTVAVERREVVDDHRVDAVRGRPTGAFARSFRLGEGLDGEAITAEYVNGVLMLTIPVTDAAKPQKVEVSAPAAAAIEG